MSDILSVLQKRSELLRALQQVTEFVTSPVPMNHWGRIAPEEEREWAARSEASDLAGVVGRLTFRLAAGLGEAICRHELEEKLLCMQEPEAPHARLARVILLLACGAWPVARVRRGLRVEPGLLTPGARRRWEQLPQTVRVWLTADSETFAQIRSALGDTIKGLLEEETAPSHDAACPATPSDPMTPLTSSALPETPTAESPLAPSAATSGRTAAEEETETIRRPRWDRGARQLWLGDESVRTFSRHAPAQFAILDAFQRANWTTSILNPVKHFSLKDAIDALNRSLETSRLRFYRRDDDRLLEWALTPV